MIKWDNGVDISCITASHVVEILRAVPDYVDETVRNSFFRVADIVEKYGLDSFVANPREFLCNRHRIHIVVSSDNENFLVSVGDENPVCVPVLSVCPNFKTHIWSEQRKIKSLDQLTKYDIVRILNRAYTHEDGRKDYFFSNLVHEIQQDSEFDFSVSDGTLVSPRYNLSIMLIDDGSKFLVESKDHTMEVPVEGFDIKPVISNVVPTVPEGCVRLPQDKNGKYIDPDDRPILKWTAEDSEVGSYMFLTNMTYFGTDPDGDPIWTGEGDDEDDLSDNLEGSEIVGTYRTNGVTKDIMGLLIEAVQEHDTEKTLLYAKIIADQHTEI